MNISYKIINFIKEYELSTAQVSDALGKVGLFEDSFSLFESNYKVGFVYYVATYGDSNWPIHFNIVNIPQECIVIIDNLDCKKALFGEIVAKHVLQNRQAQAIVTNGKIRDIQDIKKANLPIWFNSVSPIGCFNSKPIYCDASEEIALQRQNKFKDSIAVCDDDGVVIIEKDQITLETLEKLEFIKNQEKQWKEYVLEKQWNTYDTICLKKYNK